MIGGREANYCSGLGTCFHYSEELRKQTDELHLVVNLIFFESTQMIYHGVETHLFSRECRES